MLTKGILGAAIGLAAAVGLVPGALAQSDAGAGPNPAKAPHASAAPAEMPLYPVVRRAQAPRSTVYSLIALPGSHTSGLLEGLAIDRAGNIFVGELDGRVIRITPKGEWSVYATFDLRHDQGAGAHLVGLAVDGQDRLYVVLDTHDAPGKPRHGVWRINADGRAEFLASVPDVRGDVNQVTLDRYGNIYLTDSTLGLIWKVAPGRTMASLWFQDKRILPAKLVGNPCNVPNALSWGVNGIAFGPDGDLFVSSGGQGTLLRVKIDPRTGTPAQVSEFIHDCKRLTGMDQIAVDQAGAVYIARNFENQIVRVTPERKIEVLATESDGLDIPANISFGPGNATFGSVDQERRFLYVTNIRGRDVKVLDVGVPGMPMP
ncbi:MAG TPA: SMP-30/gluconolactonase/LRE family protein [Novosphingobium sp.]|nr:SMP-30/gluconolactonase/LRE family protein [Novosphingobium sp.]